MWVFGKIRESMESIPLELSRYIERSEEDIFLSSTTSLSHNLHNNILTPDKIPEFCLPPRLCKRSTLLEDDATAPYLHGLSKVPKRSTSPNTTRAKLKDVKNGDASVTEKKPLPFSAEGYGLDGIYESPNTRRKESLFHSKGPVYIFDRSSSASAPRPAKETNLPKKTLSEFLPLFLCKSLSESGSTESGTPSSNDSSPLRSLYSVKSSPYMPSGGSHLKGATSCPSLIDCREDRGRWRRGGLSLTTSPSCPPRLEGRSHALAPPVLFPLNVLRSHEKPQQEHIIPLQGRGKVHLLAEHTAFSTNTASSRFTVRVRVVSVEGLRDTDRRTLNCAVNLYLTPGKLQQQESATIRNCRSPLFNEDFFFTELRGEDLQELQLRLKVVNKPAAGTMKRGIVVGTITKPLSQLLPLNNN